MKGGSADLDSIRKLPLTISFDDPDEDGWIVAHIHGIPGAISQGRTGAEARESVIDALRHLLTSEGDEAIHSHPRSEALEVEIRL